ncbi:MAG: Fic family protein [Erysipelotrichaceae bacterium]|jgi:prophage maintenance system killer protein
MTNQIQEIQSLLQLRADLTSRLNLMSYDGTPEIKEINGQKYLYVRKRIGSKVTSKYVDVYSDNLYEILLRNARESKELRREIRHIEKDLVKLGYQEQLLNQRVVLNLDFARINIKSLIYDQAVLEGVATSFPQTEEIIENGKVSGVTASDIQKILNLKHAWEFILDKDVINFESNFQILSHIGKMINEGFYVDGGRIRSVPVTIGGCSYIPPIPMETVVIESINQIVNGDLSNIYKAIQLCLYTMKTQVFKDGNKRSAIIFANHFLISKGEGILVVPEKQVSEFKRLLVKYYEGTDDTEIVDFLLTKCWRKF